MLAQNFFLVKAQPTIKPAYKASLDALVLLGRMYGLTTRGEKRDIS